jgi:hypothetical protein
MFESLDEQMKHDDAETSTPKQRMLQWVLAGLVTLVVFGGLYLGVRLLE